MKFLCPYTEDDAICFACEHGMHDECAGKFTAYDREWTCTCCTPDAENDYPWCGDFKDDDLENE